MATVWQRDGAAGLLQVVLAAALWATVGVASQMVPGGAGLSGDMLGMLRMALGGPVLLALALLGRRGGLSALLRLDPYRLTSFALGSAVFQICLFRAFDLLGVTATVYLTVCLPPLLACGWALARRQLFLSSGVAWALGLALAGILAFAMGGPVESLGPGAGQGLVLAILASFGFLAMTAAARDLTRQAGPLLVAGAGLSLSGLALLVAIALLSPEDLILPSGLDWSVLSLVVYLGLGPTALAYVVYCSGMSRCRSASIGLIASMVEPGLAAALAWMVLGERLAPVELAGCLLVSAAVVLLWQSERGERMAMA